METNCNNDDITGMERMIKLIKSLCYYAWMGLKLLLLIAIASYVTQGLPALPKYIMLFAWGFNVITIIHYIDTGTLLCYNYAKLKMNQWATH
jgi:hypothetical protein